MLFNSIEFLFFFPIVTLLYFIVPHRFRWIILLIASCFFYMYFIPVFILILFFTIVTDYFAGILIESTLDQRKRKQWLVMSIFANLLLLGIFKYYNFFIVEVGELIGKDLVNEGVPYLHLILPIGLSFHTFQSMSYTIEVYRGCQKAERHFGIFSLYVLFYPQLVAGPIERPQNLLPQFYEKHLFNESRIVSGLRLMLWGMFKKVVIADRLAETVNAVFDHPAEYEGASVWVAFIFFTVQIYCDFSGYSDIAIGSARVMGFNLRKNFDRPFFSSSIKEFWQRWHMSLSKWFKDYLYISLGGNRRGKVRNAFNLFLVFLLSGLWHGANITYMLWGSIHGFYMLVEQGLSKYIKFNFKWWKVFKIILVFFLFTISLVVFRSSSVSVALSLFKNAFHLSGNHFKIGVSLILIAVLFATELFQFYIGSISKWLYKIPLLVRWSIYFVLTFSIIFLGINNSNEFIYFQF